ncbi:uncharacterized protein [Dermacentor albipictus]|uniref:uncharacterized protein n=1 Tax=Dermacentor albipictus TaxID=60249 RepID=UPI0038FC1132
MASQGKRYALCGFTEELDWRELHFVEPIPAHRICDACGVLPRVTVFLPCRHVLCESCYEQSVLDGGHACPLDGGQFLEEDADRRDFPLENLLRRKVQCWNKERGCDAVLAVSDLNKHFSGKCRHHSTPCPKCSMVVLRTDVCAHLQSECKDYVLSLMSRIPEGSDSDQKAIIRALKGSLDKRVGELKDRLDQFISDNSQCDHLNEISDWITSMKETLLEILTGNNPLENIALRTAASLSASGTLQEALTSHGEKLREHAEITSKSNEALRKVLEDTKRTLVQKAYPPNTLQEELRESLVVDSVVLKKVYEGVNALKEIFRNELQDATRKICRNLSESGAGIGESHDVAQQDASRASN